MPSYLCKCIDSNGKISNRWIHDCERNALVDVIREQGLTLVSIKKSSALKSNQNTINRRSKGKSLSGKLILEFSLTLRSLLRGGITVREALTIQKKVSPYSQIKTLISGTVKEIDNGGTFHDALAAQNAGFSGVYLGLIKAGEKTGDLAEVLDALIVQMKRNKKIREKLISAAIYPCFVLSALALGLMLLFLVVLPGISKSFSHMQMGEQLQILSEDAFRSGIGIGVIFGIILFIAAFFSAASRTKNPGLSKLSEFVDRIKLRVPIIGRLMTDSQMFILSSSMTSLLNQSMSMEEALLLSSSAVSNSWLRRNLIDIKQKIEKGDSLYGAMTESSAIPEYVKGWIGVGEQTAAMSQVFDQLKNFYGDRLDESIERVTAAVEPVLIVTVGIIIVYVLYAFIIPIFGIFTNIL